MNKPKINENLNERMLGELRIESMGLKAEMMKMNENVGFMGIGKSVGGTQKQETEKIFEVGNEPKVIKEKEKFADEDEAIKSTEGHQ